MALVTTLLIMIISLTVIGGFTFFTLRESKTNTAFTKSIESRYIAEGGIEDMVYRVVSGKQYLASETLDVGNGTTTLTVSTSGNQKTVRSAGKRDNFQQNLETKVTVAATGVSFFYGVQVDAGGVTMSDGAQINGNMFSNGSITGGTVTGTATVATGSGNQIANATVGGTARAPAFANDTVSGSACPPTSANCIIANDPPQPLPMSDSVIQGFRNDAAAGGTVGDQSISGTVSLGPKKINGDLNVNNGATLIVTGTLWVTGQFQASNNATVQLASGYGANSGVIVGDDTISISNNTTMSGSGQAGSYIMVVAAKNAPASQVLNIKNNANGAIFSAPHGRVHFKNNAGAKEVTGYGFDLDNNATVTYESGLQNVHFVSGPSGGYSVDTWQQVP